MRLGLAVPVVPGMSREDLVALVADQDQRLAAMAGRMAELEAANAALVEANAALAAQNEELADKLARLEYLLSRNSKNSSSPPSKDGEAGKAAAPEKGKRGGQGGRKRGRGKQPGARGFNLGWSDDPDERLDRFPLGRCECGHELAEAEDLGVVGSYQQHEIPRVSVKVTQYDQHAVRCGCGEVHTAGRPEGARDGVVGYGPNLQSFIVFLMVMHFVPAHRCAQLLESLTGASVSVGFVHGMLARVAGLVAAPVARVRALVARAHAVCCDETPLKAGPRKPKPGRKKAEKYLLVACTDLYTYYLLGDRDLETFKALGIPDLAGSVIVHDRYATYDSAKLGELTHQLCCQHILRDVDNAAEVYPDAPWPAQVARALRGLIHQANLARDNGQDAIDEAVRKKLTARFRRGVRVGLSETANHGDRPGERKTRLLLETLDGREDDVLRFAGDLKVPPTSNQAERDLRPAKIQQAVSGRLTSEARTQDRYTIRGYLSTAAKHGHNIMAALRDAIVGRPWMPPDPTPD